MNFYKFSFFAILSFVLLSTTGCKKSDNQFEIDQMLIEDYIAANNLATTVTSSGLHYLITEEGSGPLPATNISTPLYVNYTGTLLDGSEFDKNTTGPFEVYLSSVMAGWQEGLPKFKKGAKGILLIPSSLAYGSSERTGIPANSVLRFDIEMIDF